jgi:hypothetical protein
LPLLKKNAEEIRDCLSLATIPALDLEIIDREMLEELIETAKSEDRLRTLDFERFLSDAPKRDEIAEVIVVQLDESVPWPARPRVDEKTGLKRLRIGAILGQVAIGGALAVGNIALGVVTAIITSIPVITAAANVPSVVALSVSTFTGINTVLGGVEKLAAALKE